MENFNNLELNARLQEYTRLAVEQLTKNQECYVAQWILQNPDKNIEEYNLVHQTTPEGIHFYIKKRGVLYGD